MRSRINDAPNRMWPIPATPEMEADNPFEITFPVVSMIPLVTIIMAVRGRAMEWRRRKRRKLFSSSTFMFLENKATIRKRKVPNINR